MNNNARRRIGFGGVPDENRRRDYEGRNERIIERVYVHDQRDGHQEVHGQRSANRNQQQHRYQNNRGTNEGQNVRHFNQGHTPIGRRQNYRGRSQGSNHDNDRESNNGDNQQQGNNRPRNGRRSQSSYHDNARESTDGDNQQQRNNRSRNVRPNRTMGFRYVEELINNGDSEAVMFKLSNDSNGFQSLVDDRNITDDMIICITKLLTKVCSFDFSGVKSNLLVTVLQSRFFEKLAFYISSITMQNDQTKRGNTYFWKDPDEFWNNLLIISKTVVEITPSHCEIIQTLLNSITTFIPIIESKHRMHISDSIKEEAQTLLNMVQQKINDMAARRPEAQVRRRPGIIDDTLPPPNDFREIEIIPSADEVTVDRSPYLRSNIIDRPYDNVDHYLDVQFRLLREDFIAPLRRGICKYLNQEKHQDIKVYNPIRFLNVETVNECNCFRIQFDFSKKKQSFTYEKSKRFMFGSLVCFTRDNFNTVLFGKIVDRDIKLLQSGHLIVGFQQEVDVRYNTDYLMVESSVYFEPYYHVLGVLKTMNINHFPMEKYIVNVETDSNSPGYIRDPNVMYDIDGIRCSPRMLDAVRRRFYGLNDSQLNAFKAALTKEFCIIQGPPGTGKTFLGLKIARTLIQNRHAWFNQTPILVICYTNHALDQFLEGLLPLTDQIMRVGGQSKNENLKDYNLMSKRQEYHKKERVEVAIFKKRDEVRNFMKKIKSLKDTRDQINACDSVLSFKSFKGIPDYEGSWFAQAKQEQIIKWLMEGAVNDGGYRQRNDQAQLQEEMQNLELGDAADENIEDLDLEDRDREKDFVDDIFDNIHGQGDGSLITLKQLEDHLKTLNRAVNDLNQHADTMNNILQIEKIQADIWETESYLNYISQQLDIYKNTETPIRPQRVDLQNPFLMPPADRWRLYFYWLNLYKDQIRAKFEEADTKFKEVYQVYNELREMEDTQIMKQNLVVGMTTTGAARLQSSLKALRSPIVIVEEAAEVLEAHIVSALTRYCQHLILIGDHLQLKPGAADHTIETKYKLGISLFERMVNNKIECYTLNVQHRMRPEISRLIRPHIYPHLEDDESTRHRLPILGIDKCLYFINHTEKEDPCQDLSKKNIHEAKFLIALARHLILNGYKPEQITILSAYLGQMFEMVREKKKPNNNMYLQDVRISVLDNYQGEESDIILLSLVRSNDDDIAGFLKTQNRVCVALSRARDGFYLMGNMKLLLNSKSENQIWKVVNDVLVDQDAIGTHLPLRCQIHPYRFTQVSKSEDFKNVIEGGCDLMCEAQIACGHVCKRRCHIHDRDHNLYRCGEKCNKLLCDNPRHTCRKLCYEDCGHCDYTVRRELDCGHTVSLPCHVDHTKHKCMEPVLTMLPCDHIEQKPCCIDPDRFQCPHPCDTRVEPCGHACSRKCHIRVDPDHLEYRCIKPCAKPRVGCKQAERQHICSRYCFQDCEDCSIQVKKTRSCGHVYKIDCKSDVEEIKCEKPCKKTLLCGHQCKNKCLDKCGPCEEKVEKIIPDCGHKIKIKCSVSPERRHCQSDKCPRKLACGHDCTNSCASICTQKCKEIVDCNKETIDGHRINKIKCYLTRSPISPAMITQLCTDPCGAELKCKHKCTGSCGECMQGRIHKRCTEKCGVPLVCNHECPIPCREACKPCTRPCGIKCGHNKCRKKCGEPCTPCTSPCLRRCEHVQCRRTCGEICDVAPCTERCRKRLNCGHPCVGFCGDPCPKLCKVCNEEELTDIFLGSEDDPDAIYVMLNDCKHIFESTDLDEWLNQNENEIKFKVCPRCTENITTTSRYSDYIKRSLKDVLKAKEKSFGQGRENDKMRVELTNELFGLRLKWSTRLYSVCPKLKETIEALENRLKPTIHGRRQPINNIELNAIKSKMQTLTYINECFKDVAHIDSPNNASVVHLDTLLKVLLRSIDHVTDQEVEDLELEIQRLHRIDQYDRIKKLIETNLTYQSLVILEAEQKLRKELFTNKRYSDLLDKRVKLLLTNWSTMVNSSVTITDKERMDIVKAVGLAKGHWFKCPNGHPYVIGECGGAMEVARCFCGAAIGGREHRLLQTNQFAGEMDGAQRHAWPGGLH